MEEPAHPPAGSDSALSPMDHCPSVRKCSTSAKDFLGCIRAPHPLPSLPPSAVLAQKPPEREAFHLPFSKLGFKRRGVWYSFLPHQQLQHIRGWPWAQHLANLTWDSKWTVIPKHRCYLEIITADGSDVFNRRLPRELLSREDLAGQERVCSLQVYLDSASLVYHSLLQSFLSGDKSVQLSPHLI